MDTPKSIKIERILTNYDSAYISKKEALRDLCEIVQASYEEGYQACRRNYELEK